MRREMRSEYVPVSTDARGGPTAALAQANARSFRKRMTAAGVVALLLLLAIYVHNVAFYHSVRPLLDSLLSMQDYVVRTQWELRADVFELLRNISTIFEGRPANAELSQDVATLDLTETAEYKEYVLMKERNARLEDEIQWLVLRSNVGSEDPIKQAQYELEHQQSRTKQLASTLQAKQALLEKIDALQRAADKSKDVSAETDEEMSKLVEYMQTMQAELTQKHAELAKQRQLYHQEVIVGRRVDEAMGVYMDDGAAVGRDIVELGPNISQSVEAFGRAQQEAGDSWDRGPGPLLCYSLVDEVAFQPRSGGGDPLAVLAWRRWSKVCGRYVLFAEALDTIPPAITRPAAEPGGYGLVAGRDLVVLTPRKHSTPLKSFEKFGLAILFLSQHIGCDANDKPLNPVEGIAEGADFDACLQLQQHEWFVHLDVKAYFFRPNLYYLLDRLAHKHERDWLTVTDKKVLDFRSQGEYLGLPNFSEHVSHNSGFFFLLSKAAVDRLTTVFRESKKRGSDAQFETRCSWSAGHGHSFLPTCVDGCASHADLITAQRLCENIAGNPNSGSTCGGVISVAANSYQLRQGNVPQYLASSSETAYVMKCSAKQLQAISGSASIYPQNCGLTNEAPFDEQLGRCLFDLGIFLRKTSDMYGREAFAIVNPYRISEIENYPVLQKYFDGRFNENFGTPQNHFSPLLAATYMGFEPAAVGACAAALFDRMSAASHAAATGTPHGAAADALDAGAVGAGAVDAGALEAGGNGKGEGNGVKGVPDLAGQLQVVLLEEQLPELKLLLDLDEADRDCRY